ncbi:hypothetical protein KLN56_10835 [Clostridioides difficile]|nr:hypothetical protein [Clostridioides difficile]MDO0345045.1 hypothetical protein [Clostridioides difficile]
MNNVIYELLEWLKGEKFTNVDKISTTMTEQQEELYKYELATNRMINNTIKKIELLTEGNTKENCDIVVPKVFFDEMENDRDRFYNLYHSSSKEYRDYKMNASKRIDRLLKEHEFLMTSCLRYEKENQDLNKVINRNCGD